jgi:uncharacterized protein (DUF433 family)
MCDSVLVSAPDAGKVTVLDQEMYTEAEAARLLRVSQSTLHHWLEGGARRGKTYPPIIREEARGGHPDVTWAEFVECGWLRQYRRVNHVPMGELRAFISKLREEYGVPYPLAHERPFANQGQLVTMSKAQAEVGLDAEYCLVAQVSGQYLLTGPSERFTEHVRWEDGIVAEWLPHGDDRSRVRIRPDVRFGRPAVGGISTEVLWEQVDAGASAAEVAADFNLSTDDVQWAVSYEIGARAA